jgi:hypothetical protein
VRVSPAKYHRAFFLRLGLTLSLVWACLPEDDLASYSRAWTSEPDALQPATAADGGALPLGADAGELPTAPGSAVGEMPAASDAGAAQTDASTPLDAGADAGAELADASAPASQLPLDAGAAAPDASP